ARGARRAAGDHHHEVAHLAPRDLPQGHLDLADHIVGVGHGRDEERLGAPGQRELAAGRGLRGEREQRDRRPAPGQPPRGLPGHGEGHQRPGPDRRPDLGRGPGDGGPCGLRRARGQGERPVMLRRLDDPRHGRRGALIIDSSIWVATMTGLAACRASLIARFWTSGTCSSGYSTPRSPRATMIPSNAATTSSSAATAWGFSTFAISGKRTPISSMILRGGSASSGPCTKDKAIMSARSASAQRRSFASLLVKAGTLTLTPGRLRPLWSETGPPTRTRVRTRSPCTAVTSSTTRPSSTSSR